MRTSIRVRAVVVSASSIVGIGVFLQACRDEPTRASPEVHRASPALSVGSTGTTGGIDGLVPNFGSTGALAGKLPSTDTVTSSVPAFEIKQKGGGIAGRFEITNPNSAAIALDGVHAGVGHALLAWNLGLGRGALVITSNSNNTLPTLDVSAQSKGVAADIRANNTTSTNSAVKATTIGLGRAGDFLVSSASNGSTALESSTIGTGSAAAFRVTNTSNAATALVASTSGTGGAASFQTPNASNAATTLVASTGGTGVVGSFLNVNPTSTATALFVSTAGTGSALTVDHLNASVGPLAVFMVNGVKKIRLDHYGKGFFNGGTQVGGADVAEVFEVEGDVNKYEPGDVLVVSTRSDRRVERSREAYSSLVLGVYATKPGVLLTERDINANLDDTVPLGVIGVIPTKVSGENGAIRRGDLLVSARTPGHAMRGTARQRMLGATIGKALEEFRGPGTGKILVLVNVK
jgi:hypothetical protein